MQNHLDLDLRIVTNRIACLDVRRTDSGLFGLANFDKSGLEVKGQHLHGVGFREAPRFFLHEPYSSDDEWTLTTHEAGALLANGHREPEAWSELYETWAEGTSSPHWHPVLNLLPAGTYYLVQTTLRPHAAKSFVLGNFSVPAAPNMVQLLSTEPSSSRKLGLGIDFSSSFHGTLIGAHADRRPLFNQPLVGFALLRAVPCIGLSPQMLFFEFEERNADDPGPDADLVLVIPTTGEMILDCGRHFRRHNEDAEAFRSWEKKAVVQLIALLGIRPFDKEFVNEFGKIATWAS